MTYNNLDTQYIDLVKDILENGTMKSSRTGVDTLSVFDRQIRHKMADGFPILTTKKVSLTNVFTELLWFLRGDTNIKSLVDIGNYIWVGDALKRYNKYEFDKFSDFCKNDPNMLIDFQPTSRHEFIERIKTEQEFAKVWGEMGPIYGKQWRFWEKYGYRNEYSSKIESGLIFDPGYKSESSIDQIAILIDKIKNDPDNRRLLVSAWNVGDIEDAVLPPCHYSFQCYTQLIPYTKVIDRLIARHGISYDNIPTDFEKLRELANSLNEPIRYLSLSFKMRSADVGLGVPYNISSYGILLMMLAKITNTEPYELIGHFGDAHIYVNQIEGLTTQINREPYVLPFAELSNRIVSDISEYSIDDFELIGYNSHPAIYLPLSN